MIPEIAPLGTTPVAPFALDLGSRGDAPTITPIPDIGSGSANTDGPDRPGALNFPALVSALGAGDAQLERAQAAEDAFASGGGDLQTMVFERAKADAIVSVTAATASRVAQSVNTLANMQL